MRDGVFAYGHFDHGFLGRVRSLANRFADFVRLAETDAHFAQLVAGHDEGAEAETAATFDDLGAAVDENDLLHQAAIVLRFVLPVAAGAVALSLSWFSHNSLEFEAAFAGRVCESFHFAVVDETAAV